MPRNQRQRWKGWRSGQAPAPISGDQPKKKPGTRSKKKDRPHPWFWIKNKRLGKCGGCDRELRAGIVVAFSRPKKVLCRSCVESKGLKPTTSRTLKDERREMVERQLRKSKEDG